MVTLLSPTNSIKINGKILLMARFYSLFIEVGIYFLILFTEDYKYALIKI
jgi:hypothetical protein